MKKEWWMFVDNKSPEDECSYKKRIYTSIFNSLIKELQDHLKSEEVGTIHPKILIKKILYRILTWYCVK